MSPSDFIAARNTSNDDNNNGIGNDNSNNNNDNDDKFVMIDGKPYFPFLNMDPNNFDSIKMVVAKVLATAAATSSGVDDNNNNNNNDNDSEELLLFFQQQAKTVWNVRVVTGGITNKLFQVSGISNKPNIKNNDSSNINNNDSLLVRIFGGHGMIDRDIETSTYAALARQQIAVPYLGRFGNGRLEDWCPGMRPLKVQEMGSVVVVPQIAKALGQIHAKFIIPNHLKIYHDPTKEPTLWMQLSSWLEQAIQAVATTAAAAANDTTTTTTSSSFQTIHDIQRAKELQLERFKDEIQWLKDEIILVNNNNKSNNNKSNNNNTNNNKVGFCHNDLLAANILYSETEQRIQLIDFEYGGINYLSYDIANHFNEYAGGTDEPTGTPNYSLFPSLEMQRTFVTEYLKTTNSSNKNNNNDNNETTTTKSINKDDKDDDTTIMPSEEQINNLLNEIKGFVLANHIVWGLWAVNQASTEGCEAFDYLNYAKCRLGQYWVSKAALEKE